jgi:hypothetical protein
VTHGFTAGIADGLAKLAAQEELERLAAAERADVADAAEVSAPLAAAK